MARRGLCEREATTSVIADSRVTWDFSLEHLTSRHANRILIEGDPLPVRLAKPRSPKAAK